MRALSLPVLGLSLCFLVPSAVNASSAEVAALRQQVQDLLKRIDTLEKKAEKSSSQSSSHTVIPIADSSQNQNSNSGDVAQGPGLEIPAQVERGRKDNPLSLKVSGHINRGIWVASNGVNTNTAHVDNDNSPTRLTITGSGRWDESTEIGGTIEFGVEENSTDEIAVNSVDDSRTGPSIRIAELFVKNDTFGEFYFGQGSTASDGTMESTDLSQTTLLSAGGSQSFIAGATVFTNRVTEGPITVNGDNARPDRIMDPGDGLFRRNRFRYNTPSILGFSLQTSHYFQGADHNWDIALKYGATIKDTKIRAQGAFLQRNTNSRTATGSNLVGDSMNAAYRQFNASAGVLFPVGLSLFVGYVDRDWYVTGVSSITNNVVNFNVPNGKNYTAKIGYQFNYFEAGLTALAVDFGCSEGMFFDILNTDRVYKGRAYGIFAVQFLDRISTEVYAGYRHFRMTSNVPNETYNPISAFLVGARVKL